MDKLVTVAIASCNNGSYIERCIDSVVSQSYRNTEILVVDDGSTDDSLLRLEKYKSDVRLRVIAKENGGLSSVRQRALEEAKGEYICFIDADDYLLDGHVEIMQKKLEQDQSDICVCSVRYESELGDVNDRLTRKMRCPESEQPFRATITELCDVDERMYRLLHLSDSWNKMYRISWLRGSSVRFCMPKGLNGSDSIFNRLVWLHRPAYSTVASTLYAHVLYSSSAVHRKGKDLFATSIAIANAMEEECKNLGIFNEMRYWLGYRYAEKLFSAYCDVYQDSDGLKDCRARYKKLYNRHTNYLRGSEIDLPKPCCFTNMTVKVFMNLLYRNLHLLIPYYIGIYLKIKK